MIPEFALRLICGLSAMWCLASRRQITSGFFRIQMLLVLGLSVLATVTANQFPLRDSESVDRIRGEVFAMSLLVSGLSFVGSIAWTLERRRGGAIFGWLIFGISLLAVCSPAWSFRGSVFSSVQFALNALSAAWILGATTAAMLLGHWYLTATGMSLQPLVNYSRLFGLSVLARIGVEIGSGLSQNQTSGSNWTLLVLRWGGLLGPLFMAWLTLRILKYRNTQSATGVLYAATILVFMGEMAAGLLGGMQVGGP